MVEFTATERITDRIWTWATRLAAAIGIPVAAVAVALTFLGLSSVQDLSELRGDAQKQLEGAIAAAAAFDAHAESALASLEGRVAETEARAGAISDALAGVSRRTLAMDAQLKTVTNNVTGVLDLATATADLATKVAAKEGTEEEIDALSNSVKARVLFDEAFNEEDPERKIALYTEAIQFDSDYAYALNNRGNLHHDKGEYDRAIADYDRAVELDPDYAYAFNNRGVVRHDKGEYDRAIADYDRAVELDPDYAAAIRNRGRSHSGKGEYDRAIADFDRAIELDSSYAAAFNSKAWLLATVSDADARDGVAAVSLALKAVGLDDDPLNRDTLAAAYAEAKRFNDAIAEQERAIEMLGPAGKVSRLQAYRTRLDLYRSRQPYRQ